MPHALEKELSKATRIRARANQPRQEFLSQLVEAVAGLDNDGWGSLSEPAQQWYNDNATLRKNDEKAAVLDFPEEAPAAPQEAAPAPVKEPRAPAPAAGSNGSEGKRVGAQVVIKQILMRDPKSTIEQIEEQLTAQGYKTSRVTVSTIRTDFRASLKMLKEAGHLKGVNI